MLGVVIPAHNEKDVIATCLWHVQRAALHPALLGESVEVVLVADACTDATLDRAAAFAVHTLSIDARSVGVARGAGAECLLSRGARWLAFTDADTLVSASWLVEQLSLDADVVCGTVGVDDWSPHGEHADLLRWHFSQTYNDADEHRHIHGANLGLSAAAYRLAGGFQALASSEEVALVQTLEALGARIAWSARPRVVTSARRGARASAGFADALIHAVNWRLKEGLPTAALNAAAP
ncbi:glycosyltransferase family 2 protein [Polaromonas sp.]|uniref:glycosyltransferase n=1 Tax=Polaromonas sp. TaxID=1869339 RepID=UPI00352A4C76